MQLTDQQVAFFDTFGFLAFPGALAAEIAAIAASFEAVWDARGGGHAGRPHDGRARSCIVPFIDQSEALSALLDHPLVDAIGTSLLGTDFIYTGSDGNYYVGDTGWHSDGWHTDLRHLKIAFYLDPLTRETGSLRVMPGSHRTADSFAQTLQQDVRNSVDVWGAAPADLPAIALETRPGDLVCFNHNTKHAAFGGGAARRMFTINLAQRYPDDRIQDLRDYIAGHARFWVDRAIGETMLRTAGPGRMRHLEQVLANDGHLAELSRQARAAMAEPSRG